MSVGWQLLEALRERFNARLDASVSMGLPTGIESGDYVGVGVSDPEAAGRPASAFNSSMEWSTSIAPEGPFDEDGEVSLAAVASRSDDELPEAIKSVYAIFNQMLAVLRELWSDHDLLGVVGLWDLKPAGVELNTAQLDGQAVAYLLIRWSFQAEV